MAIQKKGNENVDNGVKDCVYARPDLQEHIEAQMSAVSVPGMTAPEMSENKDRGPLPPEDAMTDGRNHMNIGKVWKPMGRK